MKKLFCRILILLQLLRAAPLRLVQRYRHRRLVRAARRRRKERIGELYHKIWDLEKQKSEFSGDVNQLDWNLVFAKARLDNINRKA